MQYNVDRMGENQVTSRKGRVSRNRLCEEIKKVRQVTSRKGRVSRNFQMS